jgi:hypothetical protein
MRHTLLPLHERVVLRREYYMRVAIVLCFMVSLSILIGVVSLFPTFIKTVSEESDAKNAEASVAKAPINQDLKIVQQKVVNSLALLDSLKKDNDSPKISDLVKAILIMKGEVKFNSFSAAKEGTTTFTMSLQGVAPTRNELLSFKNNFEALSLENKIDLPVSSLAKSTNIQFSLQLKEKMP